MGWYSIQDPEGVEVLRVFVSTLEQLALNTPPGHTVHPL
jgi:hypothetical protein